MFGSQEEWKDKEKRKKNIVMFNVRESSKDDVKEREMGDKEINKYAFRDKLSVEGAMWRS